MNPLTCFETTYQTIDISDDTGIPGSTAIKLNLPPIDDTEFPTVSIVVPSYNRQNFFDLIIRNWKRIDYPRQKLEMIVLDDSTEITNPSIFTDNGIRYKHLDTKHTIGQKRNLLCQLANHEYIVHMDDDDWYPVESVAARIRCLLEFEKAIKKPGCIGCSRVLCLDLISNLMFEAYDKSTFGDVPATLSESTMAYSKEYWKLQQYNNDSRFAECLPFLLNRHETVCSMPSVFVVTQFTHGHNTIDRRVNHSHVSEFNAVRFNNSLSNYDQNVLNSIKAKIIAKLPGYPEAIEFVRHCTGISIKKLMKLIKTTDSELLSNPLVIDFMREVLISKTETTGHDIVYYCGPGDHFKFTSKWNPYSVTLGGSEEAVINISSHLVKKGYNVTVYCVLEGMSQMYDGVMYCNYWEWIPKNRQDVTIIWRDPSNCKHVINYSNKVLLDLHDAIDPLWLRGLDNSIQIMTKSKFHQNLLDLSSENTHVIPNGIEPIFNNCTRQKNLIICTSSPDRCIRALLRAIPLIRQQIPDAEIHWAYGFQAGIGKGGMENHELEEVRNWVKETKEIIRNTPGFVNLGRLSQEEVAKLYTKADLFIYPTTFPEIDCISLTKAMSAGVIPVVTPSGAMSEKMGIKAQIASNINQLDMSLKAGVYFNQFVDNVVGQLKSDNSRLRDLIVKRTNHKYNHDAIINEWLKVISA